MLERYAVERLLGDIDRLYTQLLERRTRDAARS